MLSDHLPTVFSDLDLAVFDSVVRRDHPLRLSLLVIDFQELRRLVSPFYSKELGRPAIEPLLMIKLEMLMDRDRLSDRQVIERATTDIAYRFFLELGLNDSLPEHSSMCYFRARLGEDGYRKIFNESVAAAKRSGLLKDRLRITDCTHLLADAATPATVNLIAQWRDRLLSSCSVFARERVEGERLRLVSLRETTKDLSVALRLSARVTHCRELLAWMEPLAPPADAADNAAWQRFRQDLALLGKVLGESEQPSVGARTNSAVDPDARRGKHGDFYDGYRISAASHQNLRVRESRSDSPT